MPPLDFFIEAVRDGVLVPALVAAGFLAVALLLTGRLEAAARIAGLLALPAGFFAGYAALDAGPWRPERTWHWLPYTALFASAAGATDFLPGRWFMVGWPLRPAVAFLSATLLVPMWPDLLPVRTWWLLGLSAAITGLWFALDVLSRRSPGPLFPLQLLVTILTGSVVILQSGNLGFAQLGGVVAAVLGATTLVAIWKRQEPIARGVVPGFAVLIPALLTEAYLNNFGSVPSASFQLVLFAPLLLCLEAFPRLRKLSMLPRLFLMVGISLVPLALAAVLALTGGAQTQWSP
jgi:hypothetical protein